jgi:hypothetical protein
MAFRIVRLGEPGAEAAPFRLRLGQLVAWRRSDGMPDPNYRGEIVAGVCEFQEGGGAYRDRYVVRMPDGSLFGADRLDLTEVAK